MQQSYGESSGPHRYYDPYLSMPLDAYRQKRDFSKTPESTSDTETQGIPTSTTSFFCVQKHLASHLHYDIRLEHNGVLLSWAIPKGTSLDPSDKRMAVRTEDHPLDYGEFEGVIPEGYRAGVVMLWSRGAWTPEVDDLDTALETGGLKFSLDGFKLKGSRVLVRTHDRSSTAAKQRRRNWLLFKHRDFWSGPVDIAELAPLSVKSEGDFDDILAKELPDVWVTARPGTGAEDSARKLMQATIESAAAKIIVRRDSAARKKKRRRTVNRKKPTR